MSNPHPVRALPAVPNLEQQKKQARELLHAARAGEPSALARFQAHHPRFPSTAGDPGLSLHHAQLVIAREYGFPSWPKLKAHIEQVHRARVTHPIERDVAYYDDRARGLVAVLSDGAPATLDQVRAWHPAYAHATDEAIRSAAAAGRFTLDDARVVYAREHGFATWEHFTEYLHRLAKGEASDPFLHVLEIARWPRRDWPQARALLHAQPELARARGTNGNTLLNLAASLVACPVSGPGAPVPGAGATADDEPGDRLEPMRMLLAAGADPNQANDRGWTPLHQAAYRNDVDMTELLLASGARVDLSAHGEGGTPLAIALFWGHGETAELLAERGILPPNLRTAAGLGRLDLIERLVPAAGEVAPEALAERAFYRPHSGLPAWHPSDDPQEILDEALVWAAKSGRVEALDLLVRRGARVGADPYRGTPLVWAAVKGRVDAVEWLLDHGADVNQRSTFGGAQHGEGVTALHLAAQNDDGGMVRFLLEQGADAGVQDALYHSTPAGWAEHFGAMRAGAELAKIGGQGRR